MENEKSDLEKLYEEMNKSYDEIGTPVICNVCNRLLGHGDCIICRAPKELLSSK